MSSKNSFLEDMNQMVIDATMMEIADQLLDDWIQSNLDEGQLFSDWRIAEMSGDPVIIDAFHKHWELIPTDQYWLGE